MEVTNERFDDDVILAWAKTIALQLRLTDPERLSSTPIYDALSAHPYFCRATKDSDGQKHLTTLACAIHQFVLDYRSKRVLLTKEGLHASRTKAK